MPEGVIVLKAHFPCVNSDHTREFSGQRISPILLLCLRINILPPVCDLYIAVMKRAVIQ